MSDASTDPVQDAEPASAVDVEALVEEAHKLSVRLENGAIELGYEVPPDLTLPENDDEPRTVDELLLIAGHAMMKSADLIDRLAAALERAAREPSVDQEAVVREAQRFLRRYSTAESAWRELTGRFLDLLGAPHEQPLSPEDADD